MVACSNTLSSAQRVSTSARPGIDKFACALCVGLDAGSLSRLEKRKRIWMAAGEANNSLECKCGVNEVLKGPPFITLATHNSRWTQAGDGQMS